MAALQSPERVRSLTLIEPAFGSLLPEAGAGLAEEKVSRSAALTQLRALVEAERHDDAAVAFIDWVQGGAGGFARLPETTQAGLRENARTLGPTIVGAQPDVSPASLRGRPGAHAGRQRRADAALLPPHRRSHDGQHSGGAAVAPRRLRPHGHRGEPGGDSRASSSNSCPPDAGPAASRGGDPC